MSFILDALRKSESERQRSTVPSVTRIPLASERQSVPAWTIAVIAVLAGAVIVLGALGWRSLQAPSGATVESGALAAAPTSASAGSSASSAPTPAAPAVPRRTEPPAITALRELTAPSRSTAAPRPAAQPQTAAAPAAQSPAAAVTESAYVPTLAELEADGVVLPVLRLELHVHSANPAQRFVFVNGRRYSEGETLNEGPRLIAINPDAAILSYGGAQFRLPSR